MANASHRGLFISDPALGGRLIAREGGPFDVGSGDFRTITGIDFLEGRSNNASTGLSNDGTLAFRLTFTDGTSGIFTATIVPEPDALPLLAFAGLTLVGCRSALGRPL
jgi:hypothetical protein